MKKIYSLIIIIILLISCTIPPSEKAIQTALVESQIPQPTSILSSTSTFLPTLKPTSTNTIKPTSTNTPTITVTPTRSLLPTSEITPSHSHHLLAFLFYENGWSSGDIWTVDEDGTNLKNITNIGYINGYAWSPDGERIAFTHYDNGNTEIYIIDADGSDLYQITNGAGPYLGMIDWSGSKIAFLRDLGTYGTWGEETKISYIELSEPNHPVIDISPVIQIPGTEWTVRQYFGLNWSPNGQWIVLHIPGAGGIASSEGNTFIDKNFGNPRWKNDSSLVIFPYPDRGIQYYNLNNNDSGYITHVESYVAVYSPDDQYIVYCDDNALMRMKSDGTQSTVIAYVKAADPVLKPTGDKLAYISWELRDFPESTGLHIINLDGSNAIQIMDGIVLSPRWQP